jgi:IS605 OrfB family transposase
MKIRKAFKYRLKTTPEIEEKLFQQAGCCRFVWNKALAFNLEALENNQPIRWYQENAFWLTFWKKTDELAFLKTCDSQALQQTLKNLDKAFKDAFDKKQPLKRIPKFKRKGQGDSFRYPQRFKFENNRVYLPKIGWVRYYNSRSLEGTPKNVTASYQSGNWYISVQVEQEVDTPKHKSTTAIGVDMGIARFATYSDNTFVEPLNSFKSLQDKLAKEQRKLVKKTKFSANWKKQKQKISAIHSKIANCRKDFLHKESTKLSKNHALIVMEDLKIRNMSSSAKGDIDTPGRNVKAKSGLNRSILDQGWFEFRRQLEYKQQWNGGELLAVDPKHTSQTCPCCQHKHKDNRQTQSGFECVECGYSENADVVGALNILARGHRVLACGEDALATSVKQEPIAA